MRWRWLFLVRVPIVLAVLLIGGQIAGFLLRSVPLRRNYMDDLAIAVERSDGYHRVVLLGDSITLNSTRRFQLGRGANDVANLATIAWTGAAAELFLLKRYLSSHEAPRYVIYASAADDLNNNDRPQLVHYYDWNVYRSEAERAFMRHFIPGIDSRDNLPHILNLQEDIVEPFFSLFKRSTPELPHGERLPNVNVRTEGVEENRMGGSVQERRSNQRLELGSLQKEVFLEICELSVRYNFQFLVIWPPLPPGILEAWGRRGELDRLDSEIEALTVHGCNFGGLRDINEQRVFTNFNRDGFHLRGKGWEEQYAADLSRLIVTLGRGSDDGVMN